MSAKLSRRLQNSSAEDIWLRCLAHMLLSSKALMHSPDIPACAVLQGHRLGEGQTANQLGLENMAASH